MRYDQSQFDADVRLYFSPASLRVIGIGEILDPAHHRGSAEAVASRPTGIVCVE